MHSILENVIQKDMYSGISPSSIFIYDVNNDDKVEILVAGRTSVDEISFAQLSIFEWKQNKLHLLDSEKWCGSIEAYAYSVIADDLDDNGDVEIVTGGYDYDLTNSCGQLRIWNWDGFNLGYSNLDTKV